MGKLLFGNDESLDCIADVRLKGHDNEPLCLGHKTTITFIGAGVRLKDDGYVLMVRGSDHFFYPLPQATELKSFQQAGMLPDPLPPYSIPLWRYGVGYSLWVVIVLVVGVGAFGSARRKKRLREDLEAPLSIGPPVLETEVDRHLAEIARPWLKANEQIDQQAYGFPEPMRVDGALVPGNKAAWAVLTNQRLLFLHVQKRPTGEVLDIDEIPRSRVIGVASDDGLMFFRLDDGSTRVLWVRRRERKLSNQVRFIRDMPKLVHGAVR